MTNTAATDSHMRNTGRVGAPRPQNHSNALVVVQRDWSGWRTAMARVGDLQDIHWSQPNGAPRRLIHASVCCNKIISGELAHECHLRPFPHNLVVCVLKSHTAPSVFEELSRRADRAEFVHLMTRSFGDTAADDVTRDTPSVGSRLLRLHLSVAGLTLLAALVGVGRRRRTNTRQNVSRRAACDRGGS